MKALKLDKDGLFFCPLETCDSEGYRSQRGCRKHVNKRHGWYYFFEKKLDINSYFPETSTRLVETSKQRRASTESMPAFLLMCYVAKAFSIWLQSLAGDGKGVNQTEQITRNILKYFRFCCNVVSSDWNIPESVVDYCIASVTLISDFVEYLQNNWNMSYSGTNDLSFRTAFIAAVLLLMVKVSRPMSYQLLTVKMMDNVSIEGGSDCFQDEK